MHIADQPEGIPLWPNGASGSDCSPAEISALFDEMWEAEREYLQQDFS
jgi:hypothetical protein